jgi:hypothetical protein
MPRIIEIHDVALDLGNIKEARWEQGDDENFSKIIVKLLTGREYVKNPYTEDWELCEPEIVIKFGNDNTGDRWFKELMKNWGNYLDATQTK